MIVGTVSIFSGEFWQNAVELIALKGWAVAKILIFFLVVRLIAYRIIDRVLKSLAQHQDKGHIPLAAGRIRTLGGLIKSVVFYVLVFIVSVMILRVFDVDPAPVLTAAGVVGLAVGFGAQKLVKDIISGFFIILENQYSVGEYVTIGAVTGSVVELGMRVTELRDDAGKMVIIANGDISLVTNHSRGPVRTVLEISVAPGSDVDKVRRVIDNAGTELAGRMAGIVTAPTADGITAADAIKITIRVSGDVEPGRRDAIETALRELILKGFADEQIKLA